MHTHIYICILTRMEKSFRSYVMKCHSISAGCTCWDQSSLHLFFLMTSEGCGQKQKLLPPKSHWGQTTDSPIPQSIEGEHFNRKKDKWDGGESCCMCVPKKGVFLCSSCHVLSGFQLHLLLWDMQFERKSTLEMRGDSRGEDFSGTYLVLWDAQLAPAWLVSGSSLMWLPVGCQRRLFPSRRTGVAAECLTEHQSLWEGTSMAALSRTGAFKTTLTHTHKKKKSSRRAVSSV